MSGRHQVMVVGPRDARADYAHLPLVWTVSKAETDWQRELSPFHLGPVPLYDGTRARCMENGWQAAKVYRQHLDEQGNILPSYFEWARRIWSAPAMRYPMGKGAKPEFLLWGEERLGYVDARKQVYWRLYRDAVKKTEGWRRLVDMHHTGAVALWDFDGFDHEAMGMPLADVIEQTGRPMGHAFVLKAMLLFGADVEADAVASLEGGPGHASPQAAPAPQMSLFGDDPAPAPLSRARRP